MKTYTILFGLGAFGYGIIEVLWRGYSHWTMMLAGGICFVLFSLIYEKLNRLPLLYKCISGSLTVTAVELIFGLIFNLGFGMEIWDYSNLPLNLLGQICLLFSTLWGFLCVIAVPAAGAVKAKLTAERSHAENEISTQSVG